MKKQRRGLDRYNVFETHVQMVERKALRSLNSLRKVKETEIISTRTSCMLQLYTALVIPQLEYGLALCLGIPGTAGLETLEVETGVTPLELRIEELAVRQAAKIITNEDDSCIKG